MFSPILTVWILSVVPTTMPRIIIFIAICLAVGEAQKLVIGQFIN